MAAGAEPHGRRSRGVHGVGRERERWVVEHLRAGTGLKAAQWISWIFIAIREKRRSVARRQFRAVYFPSLVRHRAHLRAHDRADPSQTVPEAPTPMGRSRLLRQLWI